jgi:phosphoglycerol transferase MdoB-like AlkP superfamily enzyme
MTEVTQAQGGSAADQAMMEGVMTVLAPTMIAMMAAFSILYLVLAVVQWRKATWVIPAIMLALLGYSLLSLVGGFLTMGPVMSELQSPLSLVLWLVQLAMGLVYVAAFRGGRMFDQLKRSV